MKKQKYQGKNTGKPFSWLIFSVKILLLFIAVVAAVLYTDKKVYFRADQSNNHIDRKIKSFYSFTENKNIDVLLLGNSHIVTGVDPFVLSVATGSNSFILAQAGVGIMDCWFQLVEALRHTEPKVIVLETYCINSSESESVVPLTQSFEAHTNWRYKLQVMPEMFRTDNWVQAWSPTIRNHSFLLTDTAMIKFNIKNPQLKKNDKLDLGRFARFSKGMNDSIIVMYDSLGAPVKGDEYMMSEHSKKYLKKIMKLCGDRDIPVLFLTIPMYYRHIDNYSVWKNRLSEELAKYPTAQWLDLQEPYDTLIYTKEAFENTYETNQHLSNTGMVHTAYKLAAYIAKHYQLPDRSKESVWINDFKDTDHFIYNQDIVEKEKCKSVVKDIKVGNFHIKEMFVKEVEEGNQVIIKIDNTSELSASIKLMLDVEYNNQRFFTPVDMHPFKDVFPLHHKVYAIGLLKEVKVLGVKQ